MASVVNTSNQSTENPVTGFVNQSTNNTVVVYGDNAAPAFVLISAFLSAWIIISNIFVLICFIQHRRQLIKSTFAMQICTLSVCDILVGFSTLPVYFTGFSRAIGYEMCMVSFLLFISSQVIVLFHLLGICISRLLVVSQLTLPNRSAEKRCRIVVYLAINWIVTLVIFSLPFGFWGKYRRHLYYCSMNEMFADNYKVVIAYCILFYIAPTVLTNVVYVTIIAKLFWSPRRVNDIRSQYRDSAINNSQSKTQSTSDGQGATRALTYNTRIFLARKKCSPMRLSPHTNNQLGEKREGDALTDPNRVYGIELKPGVSVEDRSDCQPAAQSVPSRKLGVQNLWGLVQPGSSGTTGNEEGTRSRLDVIEIDQSGQSNLPAFRAHRKALVLTGFVLVLFDVCVVPFIILISVESQTTIDLPRNLKLAGTTLLTVNSAINPILYAWKFPNFNTAMKKTFQSLCCCWT